MQRRAAQPRRRDKKLNQRGHRDTETQRHREGFFPSLCLCVCVAYFLSLELRIVPPPLERLLALDVRGVAVAEGDVAATEEVVLLLLDALVVADGDDVSVH